MQTNQENSDPAAGGCVSNAFTRLLSEFRNGATAGELSEAMQVCVASARETGKASEIKFTMKFTPRGEAIIVSDKIEKKLPTQEREGNVFFPTEDNNLIRNNPAQRNFSFETAKTIEAPQAPVKELPPQAPAVREVSA